MLYKRGQIVDKMKAIRAASTVGWSRSHPSGYRYEIGSRFTNGFSGQDLMTLRLALSHLEE